MQREDYIKNLIRDKNLTIKEFARKIDIPYSTLLSMLNGSIGGASVDSVIKICKHLNIAVEDLNNLPINEKSCNKKLIELNAVFDFLHPKLQDIVLQQVKDLIEFQKTSSSEDS